MRISKDFIFVRSYKDYKVRVSMLSTVASVKGAIDYLMSKKKLKRTCYDLLEHDLVHEIEVYIEEEKHIQVPHTSEVFPN